MEIAENPPVARPSIPGVVFEMPQGFASTLLILPGLLMQ
jgi:hypothetical protein